VTSVSFNSDGKTLASALDNKTTILWDVAARKYLIDHKEWVGSVAFSPDGQILASGSDDDSIILWDMVTHRPLGPPLVGHTNDVLRCGL
jgi:WD40 repeat protein